MNDALAFCGFAALAAGLWLIYPPAALVICGALILTLGCCGAANARRDAWRKKLNDRIALAQSRGEPVRGIFQPGDSEGAD